MIPGDRLTDALRQELTATVPDRRLLSAWLSGSHARGEARSDIDVGMLSDEPLDSASLFDVSGRLAARLGATVDLVDLRRAGGLLRVEATHHGRPLVPPTFEADLFTTHAVADQAAFALNRRAATQAFKQELPADDVVIQ